MNTNTVKKTAFLCAFVLIGFLAMQVPFSQILGATDLKFNLFDFYGPIAGSFIGTIWGLVIVAIMQVINWASHGFATDAGTLIRFLPMLFALLYFAKKTPWILIAPGLAMIAFWAHPEGRTAWYYAIYWIIPFAAYFFRDKFVFARALGATFVAHSIGSVAFLYAFNLKAAVWTSLIPIVWQERMLMAIGITLTYVLFNFLLSLIEKTGIKLPFIKLNPKYSIK